MIIRHLRKIATTVSRDGDHDAVVVRIDNTGDSGAPAEERYLQTIVHGLGREPVCCRVMWADGETSVYVVRQDTNSITVKFTAPNITCNLEIF